MIETVEVHKTAPIESVRAAADWILDDLDRYHRLVGVMFKAHLRHVPRIRRGDIYQLAQQMGMSITKCEEFKFDNTIWAPLVRIILWQYPLLDDVIYTRHCSLDKLNVPQIYLEREKERGAR